MRTLRALSVLWTLSACQPGVECPSFDQIEIVIEDPTAGEDERQEIAFAIQAFRDATALEGVCVERIRLVEQPETREACQGIHISGYYDDRGALPGEIVVSQRDAELLETTFHELAMRPTTTSATCPPSTRTSSPGNSSMIRASMRRPVVAAPRTLPGSASMAPPRSPARPTSWRRDARRASSRDAKLS